MPVLPATNFGFGGVSSISAPCSLTDTHPLPPTPLTCVLAFAPGGLGVVEDRQEWAGVHGGRTPLAPLPFALSRTCQAGSQGVMWKCGWLAST